MVFGDKLLDVAKVDLGTKYDRTKVPFTFLKYALMTKNNLSNV